MPAAAAVVPSPVPGVAAPPDAAAAALVAGWAADLDALVARIGRHFARSEPRQRVLAYVQGLLSPLERKNGWQLAEAAGDQTPYGVQHLLGRAVWDADAVRDAVRTYVVEELGDPGAVLVVDETGFLKKGTKSAGVQRQYSGTAGRIENCQIGVFLAYASPTGRAFLDRDLYLPASWVGDAARRLEAGVPTAITFQTKPQLARAMLERALDAGVPAAWVTADEGYGGDRRLRAWLAERRVAYVLAVKRTEVLTALTASAAAPAQATALVAALPVTAWVRLSAGEGAKGPRFYDWAWAPLQPLGGAGTGSWLLARRSLAPSGELAYYVCCGPAGTSLAELVRVAGTRWAIEESLEAAKGETGLDQYEVRRWDGWYRHVTLALLALAFLAVTRAHASPAATPLLPVTPHRAAVPSLAVFRAGRGLGSGSAWRRSDVCCGG